MKIYLSSTYEDLKDHRRAVYDALRKAGHQVTAMEDYVACDQRPVNRCLADVAKANLYIGLFAFRYGYVPPAAHGNPDGLSITELEYRTAEANPATRCLTYVLDEKVPWPQTASDTWTGQNQSGELIKCIRNHLRTEKLAPSFTSPHQLASEVQAAVSKLEKGQSHSAAAIAAPMDVKRTWDIDIDKDGSPYPGLLHFTRRYAPVFFGREVDVRTIFERLHSPDGRFLIVSGDSGSGKSSLVDAGVLPRLEAGGLPNGRSCRTVYLVPSRGTDPFDALLRSLHTYAEAAGLDPYQEAKVLAAQPEKLPRTLRTIVTKGLDRNDLVLFLDQMEELFTRSAYDQRQATTEGFLSGLYRAGMEETLWVIATIRSDFLHHCHRHTDLLAVLRGTGHYPLGGLEPYMLRDMITKPAKCAGLRIADGFANRLVQEAGTESGSLPLLAFVLQRLFEEREDHELSEIVYDRFGGSEAGGIQGVLADYATAVERDLRKEYGKNATEQLADLFNQLLVVNVEGFPRRRWTKAAELPPALRGVVESLVSKRLLTKAGEGEAVAVSIAHEKLFDAWPTLTYWIRENENALRTLSMATLDAAQWRAHDYDLAYLWHPERLQQLQRILEKMREHQSEDLREFAWPSLRLVELLDSPSLSEEGRLTAGRLLAQWGDPRPGIAVGRDNVPDIDWVSVPGGTVVLEEGAGELRLEAFEIARYPITHCQFQAFVDALDGYQDKTWWNDLPARKQRETARWTEDNAPRDTVSWYDAVAFCRWLHHRLGYEVRLPTEFEWQQAATGGEANRNFPWGAWETGRCNTKESGLNRTTAVGLYPHGTWPGGPLDMSGNLWEWCLNRYHDPTEKQRDRSGEARVLRGGSWFVDSRYCSATSRGSSRPAHRSGFNGFRIVRSAKG